MRKVVSVFSKSDGKEGEMNIDAQQINKSDIVKIVDPNFNHNHVCIVTGCGSGIGKAVAIAAAVNGLTVVGVDNDAVAAEKTALKVQDAGGLMRVVWADLTKNSDFEKVVETATLFGTIKYLANIAKIEDIHVSRKIPLEQYDLMQSLMLRAPYYLSLLVIPLMRQSADGCGVIANMASIHSHNSPINSSVLNIAHFGLRGLSRSIYARGDGKVRSFTVETGFVKPARVWNKITHESVAMDMLSGKPHVRDLMTPTDVANLVMYGFSNRGVNLLEEDFLVDDGMVLPVRSDEIGEAVFNLQ